jgi:mono/diheme cytochrome c family protein
MEILDVRCLTLFLGLSFSFAFAQGDAAKGKALFNDSKLGTVGRSCNSCHPNGKGLEKATDRKDLPKVINSCIENALKSKRINPNSSEMADLVAYSNSLKGKETESQVPKKN